MNSCAASCCTCFPKASCASGTSASSPTAGAPHSYHFAFICSAQHRDRTRHIRQQSPTDLWAMPKMRWTDDGHRKTHCCRNPTSFSPRPGHRGRMKRLSTTRNLCVCQRAQSLRALPFRKPRPSTFSSLVSYEFCAFVTYSAPAVVCRALPYSFGASRHRTFPQLNLHKARVRRNHGRLPLTALSKARRSTALVHTFS